VAKVKRNRRIERRGGKKGCAHCGGAGTLPLFRFDGDNNITESLGSIPCPTCAAPPPVSVGTSDGPWPPGEIPALRPALDAVREARKRGEA